ncbi:pathogenesis-related protein 1a [Teratosphaeria destructans]|uniref:Pathogenesis-related protein 1a n=1 Tax=Teratosphaeria destructans TaxID=418781 RepID=A0A9W7W1M0_9PEZI|nr:pathogenesis-related protein 1a [Teratosphaeria destructans]
MTSQTHARQPHESPEDACLERHNRVRQANGCRDLEWSPQLAYEAEEYAKILASERIMQHSGALGRGENLYWATWDASFDEAVDWWLAEEKDYHGQPIGVGNLGAYGHYSRCRGDG